MARIRTIKPEFWSSPSVTAMSPWARLLFIAMWNWADDTGRGTFIPRELLGFTFPNDEEITVAEFRRLCAEVRRECAVLFYESAGRYFYSIPSWKKHQSKHAKHSGSKLPDPEGCNEIDPETMQVIGTIGESRRNSADSARNSADSAREVVPGTGEQGNRGTGEGERPSKVYPQPVDNSAPGSPPLKTTPRDQTTQPPWVRGTPDDPRCPQHEHLQRWDVPPCRDCAKARQWYLDQEEAIVEATKARTAQRRAAIDNCPHCDQNGLRETPEGTLTRCTHKESQQ